MLPDPRCKSTVLWTELVGKKDGFDRIKPNCKHLFLHRTIVNRGEWFGNPANIKRANKVGFDRIKPNCKHLFLHRTSCSLAPTVRRSCPNEGIWVLKHYTRGGPKINNNSMNLVAPTETTTSKVVSLSETRLKVAYE